MDERLEKKVEKYLESFFDGSEFFEDLTDFGHENWGGFIKDIDGNQVFLIGYTDDDTSVWYYDGRTFTNTYLYFGLTVKEWNELFKKFLINRGYDVGRVL